jgi:extracellular elastinolytic metalloproteinase
VGATVAGTVLMATLLPATTQSAQAAPKHPGVTDLLQRSRADYDSRDALDVVGGERPGASGRPGRPGPSPAAVTKLRGQLGVQGIVDIDKATGTPRRVARLDGYLTAPSRKKPATVALDYVAAHADVFGLDAKAVAGLTLRKDYVDITGVHHLSFVQAVGGVPVFGNGLKAHVAKDGRLIQVDGSPVRTLPASVGGATLSAAGARAAALKDVGGKSAAEVAKVVGGMQRTTRFSDGGSAKLVLFQTAAGPRPAWQTILLDEGYVHVIDAASGEVLYRHSTVDADSAWTFANYPGAASGGTQQPVDLTTWLPKNSPRLDGYNAHVYSDVDDDDKASPAEEVTPSGSGSFAYPFTDFSSTVGGSCSAALKCSWDPKTPYSWQVNRAQNAVQMFYFLGTFHDHLKAAPIGFTRSAGNFEAADGDAVQGHANDGANTDNGLPGNGHFNNANMNTPPDGTPPRMQMYLFKPGGRSLAANSGDASDIVYHEYTHGLSNRLVVDANGFSTLRGVQAGAMGEGWSDWYAEDFLVGKGLEKDTTKIGDVLVGKYVTAGTTIRTEPLDCTVGAPATACPGTPTAGPGGYTYGDFGRLSGFAEVHDDGEIWAQTLWDLRKAIGSAKARSLVTRAMELSPENPSFLDERNSILQADLVVNGGNLQKTIWKVFAKRGMGYFAAATDGDDDRPVEDFSLPPAADTPRGTLSGTVKNQDTGAPAAGVTVAFSGHASGFGGGLEATTAADGTYTISGILPGTYPKVIARGAGHDPQEMTLSVPSHEFRQDWTVRRDWAAAAGGGSVASFTGPDVGPVCGPGGMIDQSQTRGWLSEVKDGGQNVVIKMPAKVDIAQLMINPGPACAPFEGVITGHYRVETSADGTTWTTAAAGGFPPGTTMPTPVAVSAGAGNGVQYIRYTMLTTQDQDAGPCPPGNVKFGCYLIASNELAVYGTLA